MKKLNAVSSWKVLPLLLATVLGVGFIGCSPAAVKPYEQHSYIEDNIIECRPNENYKVPELKYNPEDIETMYLTMAGGLGRPAGIQFRDINTGEIKKLFFGGKTSREYACEHLTTLK